MSRSATDSRDLVISRLLSAPRQPSGARGPTRLYSKPGGVLSHGIPTFWPFDLRPGGVFTP